MGEGSNDRLIIIPITKMEREKRERERERENDDERPAAFAHIEFFCLKHIIVIIIQRPMYAINNFLLRQLIGQFNHKGSIQFSFLDELIIKQYSVLLQCITLCKILFQMLLTS